MSFNVPCIVCDQPLGHVFDVEGHNQPYEGLSFEAFGHYGCTSFDPMDGSYLEINICDSCLVEKAKKNVVLIGHVDTNDEGHIANRQPLKIWAGPKQYRYYTEVNED